VLGLLAIAAAGNALAVVPVIKTVRAAANNPLLAHSGYPGKVLTLKATADAAGAPMSYQWDFGDGSPVQSAQPVTNPFVIEAAHAYNVIGPFTAILRVTNTSTNEFSVASYPIQVFQKTLPIEAN